MATDLSPSIALDGTCRQALEFYASVFGGEAKIWTFGEAGAQVPNRFGVLWHVNRSLG